MAVPVQFSDARYSDGNTIIQDLFNDCNYETSCQNIGAIGEDGSAIAQIGGLETGSEGSRGPPGPKGDTGPAGPQGAQGEQGDEGPAGADGAQGPAGADGAQGPAGADGAQGPAGADGAQGPAGADGAQGPAGADGAQGPAGADGAQGPAGADGAQGPAGADGAQGPAGADGAQGPAGADGAQGPAGADGAQGPAGGCADSVRIHDTAADWVGTTDEGRHFLVEGFSDQSFTQFPGEPGSDNTYTGTGMNQPDPDEPNDFFTGLDVCIPGGENSIPQPFFPPEEP